MMPNFWQLADYSWLSAKNLAYFVYLPWKLHNRYCHTAKRSVCKSHAKKDIIIDIRKVISLGCILAIALTRLDPNTMCGSCMFWSRSFFVHFFSMVSRFENWTSLILVRYQNYTNFVDIKYTKNQLT